MSACTSTSRIFVFFLALSTITFSLAEPSFAQSPQIPPGPPSAPMAPGAPMGVDQPAIPPGTAPKKDEPGMFEQQSPYLEYGDFNLGDSEEQETLYYQYGRFFGVSLGVGYEGATGNRGLLYNGAFPRVDIKVHYWFDFNLALNFGVFFANHSFFYNQLNTKVALVGFGVDLKYYFDVKNLGAAFTFANPYILGGVGAISKTQSTVTSSTDTDSTFSVGAGAGLEFPIVYKSTYFLLEARYFTQSFQDTNETKYMPRVNDLSGGFYTIMGHILFTW